MDVERIPFHVVGKTITISGDDSTLSAQPFLAAFVDIPSQEELDILLERFSTFVGMEPLVSHMNKLFLAMQRVPVDVTDDLQQNFITCIPYETSDETIEAIMRLKNYTTIQTEKLV